MNKLTLIIIIITIQTLLGCTTLKESVLSGIATGAIAGGIAGNRLHDENKENGTISGALIGGAIGGIASYFIHDGIEKRDKQTRRDLLFNLENNNIKSQAVPYGNSPKLSSPKYEETWVEPHVDGNKFIQGHKIWILTEPSGWVTDDTSDLKTSNKKQEKTSTGE